MLVKGFVIVLVGFGTFAITSAAIAQNEASHEKSLFDRLDDFGKTVFGVFSPDKNEKRTKNPTPTTTAGHAASRNSSATESSDDEAGTPRAGSILSGVGQRLPAGKVIRRPPADTSLSDDADATATPSQKIPASPSRKVSRTAPADVLDPPSQGKPVSQSLHERLAGFRQSVFGPDAERDSRPQPNLQPGRTPDASMPTARAPNDSAPGLLYPLGRPAVAERTTLGVRSEPLSDTGPKTSSAADRGAVATDEASSPTNTSNATNAESGVLSARKGPILSVETVGPRTIAVGRESTYEVHMINSGEVAAENLTVFVSLPEWTEVAGMQASTGAAETAAANQAAGAIQWKIGSLNAKERQRLTIRLIPRQSRPFDLAVRWDYKPIASQAMIEVQEAKLSVQLDGPREVLYGKKELYRLKLANTGNGNADNVVITLIPIGAGENVPASHKIGLLSAGEEKTLDVELTARQAGKLTMRAEVCADGGIRAELAEKVLVRRAGLKINLDGPKAQFVGTVATYAVRVRNPGTAPAHNVNFSIALPAGAKYLSGIDRARVDAAGGKLQWTIETLGPDVEQSFLLKCRLGAAGMSRMRLIATADDDLAASAEAVVQVDGVANLTMDVKDPTGPVPVGEEAIYEVSVRNRGTKEAQGVEVFGYFSRGVEPTSTEGAPSRLASGQVVFQPIASLAPGEEVVFKIHARAEVAGNHVFRAEAHCKPLSARLMREATNLYYGESAAGRHMAGESSGEGAAAPVHEAMRPIPRSREQAPVPPRN
jgi:uncharacterized repeat protein (TIGR01451 family)